MNLAREIMPISSPLSSNRKKRKADTTLERNYENSEEIQRNEIVNFIVRKDEPPAPNLQARAKPSEKLKAD
jgi:hypothetical protein